MRVEDWAPEQITVEVEKKAMDQLEQAGEIVAGIAKLLCPVGEVTRYERKTFRHTVSAKHSETGQRYKVWLPATTGASVWTARKPGTLKSSIRVTRLHGDPKQNIRVYAGNFLAYYARFVEYGTVKMKAKPFLRPAFNSAKAKIKAMLGAE